MNLLSSEKARLIKEEASRIGFGACGFARAAEVPQEERLRFQRWLDAGCCADMEYVRRYREVRVNAGVLVESARSVGVVALD